MTILLAKIFAIYLIVMSVGMLVNRARFMDDFKAVLGSKAVLMLSGVVTLILGIILVVIHNVWVANWTVVITVLAWIIFAKGVLRMFLPQLDDLMKKLLTSEQFYYLSCIISLVLGLYLGYMGFFVGAV